MVRKEALRLEYLDGLRAVAALYVVLFHAGGGFGSGGLPGWARNVQRALSFGHDAVAVFIVLSGYCLMLPVARTDGLMVRGVRSYLARRAWRILPPYYAALFGSLLLIGLVPGLETHTKTIWSDSYPAFELGPIASHLLLIHNLFPSWVHRINGPLWSVATEWQIYFFFPLFLLPIWRRWGALVSVIAGFALGGSIVWLAPGPAASVNSWYLGLFAFGMVAAGVGFASRPLEVSLRERAPWGAVSGALLLACALGVTVLIKVWFRAMPVSDALVGAATASGLVHLTKKALAPAGSARPVLLRILESRPLVGLGRFSYSLYLTHLPIVAVTYLALGRLSLSPLKEMLALIGLSVPASLLLAYGFFCLFERRFVGTPPALFGKPRQPAPPTGQLR